MSKKKIYIILAIMFTIFIIAMIFAFTYRAKSNDNTNSSEVDLSNGNWAVNDVKDRTLTDSEELYTKVVNDVTYTKLDNLTYEQQADKDTLYDLVISNMVDEKAEHGNPISVEILDTSTEHNTYVLVTFQDEKTQEYILVYDSYTKHSFLNCQTIERWNYYHSDANKG